MSEFTYQTLEVIGNEVFYTIDSPIPKSEHQKLEEATAVDDFLSQYNEVNPNINKALAELVAQTEEQGEIIAKIQQVTKREFMQSQEREVRYLNIMNGYENPLQNKEMNYMDIVNLGLLNERMPPKAIDFLNKLKTNPSLDHLDKVINAVGGLNNFLPEGNDYPKGAKLDLSKVVMPDANMPEAGYPMDKIQNSVTMGVDRLKANRQAYNGLKSGIPEP